jgi:hypothetical protein
MLVRVHADAPPAGLSEVPAWRLLLELVDRAGDRRALGIGHGRVNRDR